MRVGGRRSPRCSLTNSHWEAKLNMFLVRLPPNHAKMRHFIKLVKFLGIGGSTPNPLTSGGWGSVSRLPCILFSKGFIVPPKKTYFCYSKVPPNNLAFSINSALPTHFNILLSLPTHFNILLSLPNHFNSYYFPCQLISIYCFPC